MVTLATAENEALVNTTADRLAAVEVETLGEGQAIEEAEAQVHTLAEKVTDGQVNTFDDLPSVVEADARLRRKRFTHLAKH